MTPGIQTNKRCVSAVIFIAAVMYAGGYFICLDACVLNNSGLNARSLRHPNPSDPSPAGLTRRRAGWGGVGWGGVGACVQKYHVDVNPSVTRDAAANQQHDCFLRIELWIAVGIDHRARFPLHKNFKKNRFSIVTRKFFSSSFYTCTRALPC